MPFLRRGIKVFSAPSHGIIPRWSVWMFSELASAAVSCLWRVLGASYECRSWCWFHRMAAQNPSKSHSGQGSTLNRWARPRNTNTVKKIAWISTGVFLMLACWANSNDPSLHLYTLLLSLPLAALNTTKRRWKSKAWVLGLGVSVPQSEFVGVPWSNGAAKWGQGWSALYMQITL